MKIQRFNKNKTLCWLIAMIAMVAMVVGFAPAPANAQVLYGSIVGLVVDQTDAAVPAANITIVNLETGQSREVQTDMSGRYLLVNVLPGNYRLTVTATGFRQANEASVAVSINTVTRVDVELQLGAVSETVTVSVASAILKTDKADVSAALEPEAMSNLPLSGYRNYQSLINLVPGSTPAAFQNSVVDTPARALSTNVNGTNRNNNNTRVDGATNVFIWLPHHTVYVAPVETIEAVNITTGSFDAEQGMAGGAAITVATKSGTNDLHGVASWYHDNEKLRARNYFLATEDKPSSTNNVVTGTISGPIIKNKLFYFFGYERYMERSGKSGNYSVPTEDQRLGDFSAYDTVIYDPLTGNADGTGREPFANNTIPSWRQSDVTQTIQDDVPLANLSGTLNNYATSATQKLDRDNYDLKINFNPAASHALFGKFSRMDALVNGQNALGDAGGPGLGTLGTGDTTVNILTFGDTWTISPTFLADATFGYTRFDQTVFGPDYGTNYGSEIWGIPGTNGDDIRQSGMPCIDTGYTDWGNCSSWMPLFRNDRSFTFTLNFSKIHGAHDLRWGVDVVRHHMDHWQPEVSSGPRGRISYNGSVTALSGGASPDEFNTYASALLGYVSEYEKAEQNYLMTNREWQFGFYLRDRWQLTRKLTFNLGLRYEYYPLITRKTTGIERWDPDTNMVLLGGVGDNPDNVGITTSKLLFAPRLGIAYRLDEDTVIRSGYGITYDPLPFSRPLRGLYPATIGATWPSDSYQYYNEVSDGLPDIPIPNTTSGSIELPADVSMGPRSAWEGEIHRGYIQSWNFTIERQLPSNFLASIAYVGNSTVHQLADRDINAAAPGAGTTGRPLYESLGRAIDTDMWDGWLSSNYHSLQLTLNRQLSSGLFMKGAYTFSKAINMTDDDGWAGVSRNWDEMISWNRARAGYDRTHMFIMAFVYDVPFGPGKAFVNSGIASKLLRNWQMNGTFSAYTGTPFTVSASDASLNAPGNTQSADQILSSVEKYGGIGSGAYFYNPEAFAAVEEVRFGTSGRNILTGPGLVNLDFSLFRKFDITERVDLQFRAEAFNLTNTPHFSNPNSNASSGDFMTVTSAATDERQFRFGVRLSF